jgi:pentatricopeptide repeat protein
MHICTHTFALDGLVYTMMRLYAQAGRFQKTRWLYYRLRDQDGALALLLTSLVRSPVKAKGPVANHMLREYLQKFTLEPREAVLVYLAWKKTAGSASGSEAMAIHNQHMKGRTDLSLVYFNALLACLAESKNKYIKPLVDEIMKGLQENGLEPDETTYTLAVRALLEGGRAADAEKLFQVMVHSKTPPNIRTMNTILLHHARYGELASAIHCESTLNQLNKVADHDGQLHVKPNVVTYNIILQAWAKTDAPFSANRLWKIYHRMLYRGIEPNMVTYNTLINYFTKTIELDDLKRANDILKVLEEHPTLKPTKTQYYRIMKTWMDCEEYHMAELVLDRRIASYISGNNKVAPVAANYHQLAMQCKCI